MGFSYVRLPCADEDTSSLSTGVVAAASVSAAARNMASVTRRMRHTTMP
jgi:hypothetical protein